MRLVVSPLSVLPLVFVSQALFRNLWLKLPSRLKILVENRTSVLSIHLDQVPARSVEWPLVYFFPFKLSCHLLFGPLFPSSYIFPSITPFLHGPACHCGRSRLFPSSTFSTPFSLLPIGP